MTTCKAKVSLIQFRAWHYINLGVYTFGNGIRARAVYENGEFVFDNRVIFAEDDYRMEYRGELKDNHIMHGKGTLTLKN